MKEEILQIASDLREGHIISNEAKAQLLRLFGVSSSTDLNHKCSFGERNLFLFFFERWENKKNN